ncbi:hypothetical protein LOK49_Contig10G00022 [Camellia lanceoleosa]|nr:hypothetical protein LOK49_Contig10G00022 [Camellia lanceoleosa]
MVMVMVMLLEAGYCSFKASESKLQLVNFDVWVFCHQTLLMSCTYYEDVLSLAAAVQEIGKAGSKFIQEELKMKSVYDYMFHLLYQYGKLLKYKPTVPEGSIEVCLETMACFGTELEKTFKMNSMIFLLLLFYWFAATVLRLICYVQLDAGGMFLCYS